MRGEIARRKETIAASEKGGEETKLDGTDAAKSNAIAKEGGRDRGKEDGSKMAWKGS